MMKLQDFKNFLEHIETADSKDPVWHMGYLFLDLTPKQMVKVQDKLVHNFGFKYSPQTQHYEIVIPSGLGLLLTTEQVLQYITELPNRYKGE